MRKIRRILGPALLIAGVMAFVSPTIVAQRRATPTPGGGDDTKRVSKAQIDNAQARIALATAIVNRFDNEAQSRGLSVGGWRQATLETLLPLSLAALERVSQEAHSLDAIAPATAAAAEDPNLIGDPAADLVYTPIAPCRYVDTRFYAAGKISGTRGFDLSLTGASYGASAACHMPTLFGTGENGFGALAMNVTVVDTSTAGSPGFLAAKPTAAAATTSLLNWFQSGVDVQVANQGIVTTDQAGGAATFEFVITTSGSVHVIIDIFGAFIEPQATALQRTLITDTINIAAPAGSTATNTSLSCPAQYTTTGGGCSSNGLQVYITDSTPFGTNQWTCTARNFDGVIRTLTVFNICSRIPGR